MEFISAKDLPITEAEEIDVLCVESGELKRKSASGLSNKVEYDLEINFKTSYNTEEGNFNCEHTVIHQEDFEVLKNKILSGEPIQGKFIVQCQEWGVDSEAPYAVESIVGHCDCIYGPEDFGGEGVPESIWVSTWGCQMVAAVIILPDNSLEGVYGGFD